jgi:predicted nucleic acid-binding protein
VKRQIVVLDANILFPAPLRDFFMHLGITGAVRIRWSAKIEEEWTRNLLTKRSDLNPDRIKRTAQRMNLAIPDAMVTGFEALELSLSLPDKNDHHVLAAAIKANADAIITKNLRDFPSQALAEYDIEALHPDEFVHHLLHLEPRPVIQAIRALQKNLLNPPKSMTEVLDTLEQQEMPLTATWLRTVFDDDWKNGMLA